MAKNEWRPRTRAVHEALPRTAYGELGEALFLTASYAYDSAEQAEARMARREAGYTYTRLANPTVRSFERRMAALEGAEDARATATGMAAVTASLLSQLRAGDHVVAGRAMFGACRYVIYELLPRYGIEATLVDARDLAAWQAAMRPNTAVLFLETPSNPMLEIADIGALAALAHENSAQLIIDNVFATPILQRPLEFGADIIVHSATKYIDGQGRCMGGCVLGRADYIGETLDSFIRQTGPCLSPFNAWVMLKGLETLPLRMAAHCDGAAAVAAFLRAHKKIARVYYPDAEHPQSALAQQQMARGGALVTCDIVGGKAAAYRFLNALEIGLISNNLGDAKTLLTHPATTTHALLDADAQKQLDISGGTVRISVGLEDPQDLIADFERALAAG